MGKILIVAEKPSVARDIAKALGGFANRENWLESDSVVVTSAIGHLVTLHVPESETGGKSLGTLPVIPSEFQLQAIDKTRDQFEVVKKLLHRGDIDIVYNACDAGREGELIFTYIYEYAGCRKPVKRMWLQSMTTESILTAFSRPRDGREMLPLAAAAKCRSESDWLVGINGSRAVTQLNTLQTKQWQQTPVGRVQTPTLAIVVHLERRIQNFVPEDYWELHGTFETASGGRYTAPWVGSTREADAASAADGRRFTKLEDARAMLAACQGQNPSSAQDESSITKSSPPRLFDLTSLQREANKRYKMSSKATLDAAQSLYERHKATSYPRTDSNALPEDYVDEADKIMRSMAAQPRFAQLAAKATDAGWVRESGKDRRIFDNTKISDHFAIIPTGRVPDGLSPSEEKIYELVVRRFIASFYPDAEFHQTKRTTVVASQLFVTSGRVLVKAGWKEVYGSDVDEGKEPSLCPMRAGEAVKTTEMELLTKRTRPPLRLTEGTLLSAMEKAGNLVDDEELSEALKERGLGTPATRSAIIENLLRDKAFDRTGKEIAIEPYMRREGKEQFLVPSDKGLRLIDFLEGNNLGMLTSPAMTGDWEAKLRRIESGQLQRADFMGDITTMVRSMLDEIRHKASESGWSMQNDRASSRGPARELPGAKCPSCGAPVFQSGDVAACSKSCGFTMWTMIAQRKLNDDEIAQLLRDRKLPVIDGFLSKEKKSFSAGLAMGEDFKVSFVFDRRPGRKIPDLVCPKCDHNEMEMSEGKFTTLNCMHAGCGFKLWMSVSGKTLTEEQARRLLQGRELPEMSGFTSKAGKSFSAGLKLSPDKTRVEFVFKERARA